MLVKLNSFLKAIGCNISETDGDSNVNCPICNNRDRTLVVHDVNNSYIFECINVECGFIGNAVELVARSDETSIATAADRFIDDSDLAQYLVKPLDDSTILEYSASSDQVAIKDYLFSAYRYLRYNPDKVSVPGLNRTTLYKLPSTAGIIVDNPPSIIDKDLPKGISTTPFIFPYKFNNNITSLSIYSTTTLSTISRINVTQGNLGVYPDVVNTDNTVLLSSDDPYVATVLYGNYKALYSNKPPVVSILGYPLPASMSNVTDVIHLYGLDVKLDIVKLIQLLSYVADDYDNVPTIRIVELDTNSIDLKANAIDIMLNKYDNIPIIHEWILNKIKEDGKLNKEYSSLLVSHANYASLSILAESMSEYPGYVKDIVATALHNAADSITLGNGTIIKRTSTSLIAVTDKGDKPLANFGIDVVCKISGDNDILYCRITPDTSKIPQITVNINESDMTTAANLRKVISRAFSDHGYSPYIAVYRHTNIEWSDILGKLAERCKVQKTVNKLGSDNNSTLHLPELSINKYGQISPQLQLFDVNPNVSSLYSNIKNSDTDILVKVPKLLKSNNYNDVVYSLCLSHIIFSLTNDRQNVSFSRPFTPYHLMLIGDAYIPILEAIMLTLSGSKDIPMISAIDYKHTLNSYANLGTAPLVSIIPEMIKLNINNVILKSDISIIGVISRETANNLEYNSRLAIIDGNPDDTKVNYKDVDYELAKLLSIYQQHNYGSLSSIPAESALLTLCRALDIQPNKNIKDIIKLKLESQSGTKCS